jgi:hypothetical protein
MNPMTAIAPALSSLAGSGAGATSAASQTAPAPFADLLTDAVGQVKQLENQAHAAVD